MRNSPATPLSLVCRENELFRLISIGVTALALDGRQGPRLKEDALIAIVDGLMALLRAESSLAEKETV